MERPDRDYPFTTLLSDTPAPDSAPGWAEILYALATLILMWLVVTVAMTQ